MMNSQIFAAASDPILEYGIWEKTFLRAHGLVAERSKAPV